MSMHLKVLTVNALTPEQTRYGKALLLQGELGDFFAEFWER